MLNPVSGKLIIFFKYRPSKTKAVSPNFILTYEHIELAQFPVKEGWGRDPLASAFIKLAQGVVDAIWLDLGALNQGYEHRATDPQADNPDLLPKPHKDAIL